MKILDTTNGHIHEYGSNQHDSLEISSDGCSLHYYNLQCGDGSKFGTYRFVMEDGKIPAESQTEDARYAECYFNIGGFGNSEDKPAWQRVLEECIREDQRPHGEWIFDNPTGYWYCSNCKREPKDQDYMLPFCAWCGSDNRTKDGEEE